MIVFKNLFFATQIASKFNNLKNYNNGKHFKKHTVLRLKLLLLNNMHYTFYYIYNGDAVDTTQYCVKGRGFDLHS